MLVNRYQTVYLSFIATDLPIWNVIEATAHLYQQEPGKFYLLLHQSNSNINQTQAEVRFSRHQKPKQELFWLEIAPNQIMLTMQSNSHLSYRHFWEQGASGISRYYLNQKCDRPSQSLRFRNFTRYLKVECDPFPRNIRLEYELWSKKIQLGSYIVHVDIDT